MVTDTKHPTSREVPREAAARLQAWLDADDATHFGQHEKDIQALLDSLDASPALVESGDAISPVKKDQEDLRRMAEAFDSSAADFEDRLGKDNLVAKQERRSAELFRLAAGALDLHWAAKEVFEQGRQSALTKPIESAAGLPDVANWIVWSNEHRAFWAPNRCGYTGRIEKAGRYTKAEAEAICNGANYRATRTIYEGTPPEICMPAPEALASRPIPAEMPEVAGLCERLRTSAKAFRENPVYDSEGDGFYISVQADEMEEAATALERMGGVR